MQTILTRTDARTQTHARTQTQTHTERHRNGQANGYTMAICENLKISLPIKYIVVDISDVGTNFSNCFDCKVVS